jgi:hypothetical protein
LFPLSGNGAELGTRQRTITPVALSPYTPLLYPEDVAAYAIYGYSSWRWGSGEDEGQQLTNMPAGYTGATNAARLLSFLCISDAHITDKESPCQAINATYQGGIGDNPSTYSPVMLYTTQVLDAAVKTVNAVNRLTPFDFGISLGDDANGPQYNELRWFIDVMDGQYITPSSGTNAGANTIDYQNPSRPQGLTRPSLGMQCSATTIISGWGEYQSRVPNRPLPMRMSSCWEVILWVPSTAARPTVTSSMWDRSPTSLSAASPTLRRLHPIPTAIH